jgi:cell division protein FtsB
MSYSKKYLKWHINNKASVNALFVEADAEIERLEAENKELNKINDKLETHVLLLRSDITELEDENGSLRLKLKGDS